MLFDGSAQIFHSSGTDRPKTDRQKKKSTFLSALARAHTFSLFNTHTCAQRHAEQQATTNPPTVLARAHAAFERGFFAGRAEGNFTPSWISNVRFCFFSFPVFCFLISLSLSLSLRVVSFAQSARDADDFTSLSLSLFLSVCMHLEWAGTSEVF